MTYHARAFLALILVSTLGAAFTLNASAQYAPGPGTGSSTTGDTTASSVVFSTGGTLTLDGNIVTLSGDNNNVTFAGTSYTNDGTLTFDLGVPPDLSVYRTIFGTYGSFDLEAGSAITFAGVTTYKSPTDAMNTINLPSGTTLVGDGTTFSAAAAPEPSSILMAMIAAIGFFGLRRVSRSASL